MLIRCRKEFFSKDLCCQETQALRGADIRHPERSTNTLDSLERMSGHKSAHKSSFLCCFFALILFPLNRHFFMIRRRLSFTKPLRGYLPLLVKADGTPALLWVLTPSVFPLVKMHRPLKIMQAPKRQIAMFTSSMLPYLWLHSRADSIISLFSCRIASWYSCRDSPVSLVPYVQMLLFVYIEHSDMFV